MVPERASRYRYVIFALVAINQGIVSFSFNWGATLSGFHTSEWNLEASQLGLLAASGFFAYALIQIPGGYITDWLGARKAMSVAIIILAIGTGIFAGASSFADAVVGRTIMGFSSGVVTLPSLKLLARWFRVGEFATIQGVWVLFATIGSLLATLPLALIAEVYGWRAPMWGMAILTLAAGALTSVFTRDDPREISLPLTATTTPHDSIVRNGSQSKRISLREGFQVWRRTPTLWVISLIAGTRFRGFALHMAQCRPFGHFMGGAISARHVYDLTLTQTGNALRAPHFDNDRLSRGWWCVSSGKWQCTLRIHDRWGRTYSLRLCFG